MDVVDVLEMVEVVKLVEMSEMGEMGEMGEVADMVVVDCLFKYYPLLSASGLAARVWRGNSVQFVSICLHLIPLQALITISSETKQIYLLEYFLTNKFLGQKISHRNYLNEFQ